MSLFKKKNEVTLDLKLGKEVVYRVTITKTYVQIESASKDWQVQYSLATMEAGLVNSFIVNADLSGLTAWVRIQSMMRVEVRYLTLSEYRVKRFIELFPKKCAEIEAAVKSGQKKQSDAEILAEEKVLSEKTAESIKELETIKKKKK